MFKYEGRNPETLQVKTIVFATKDEAQDFAIKYNEEYPVYKITPVLIDGMILNEDFNPNYNEEQELKMMGLNDEETSEGFDRTGDRNDE